MQCTNTPAAPTATTTATTTMVPPSPAAGNRRILAAAWTVTAVFILSNSATPLYGAWQHRFAFSATTLTVVFAAYIAGLLGTLLVAGHLADRLGRKAVLVPGVMLAMAACALFATAASVGALVAARFLTGVAVGVIVSAGMAAVVDVGGPERRRQAARAASVAMVLGAGLGPLLAGTMAQWLARPVWPIFGIEFLLLASALAVLLVLPLPPVAAPPAAVPERLRLPSVPSEHRVDLLLGVAVFAPGLSATSFMLSLGPTLLSQLLHVRSPLVAGGLACLMFMSATAVQFAVGKRPVRTVFVLGATATAAAMAGLLVAVHAALPALLPGVAMLAGMGQGLGQLGGLSLIGMNLPDRRRAQANALLNIGAYIPAGLLPVAAGFLADRAGLAAAATTFAIVLMASAAAAARFVVARAPR